MVKAGRYDKNGFKERKQGEVKRQGEMMERGRREEGDGTVEEREQTNEEKKEKLK